MDKLAQVKSLHVSVRKCSVIMQLKSLWRVLQITAINWLLAVIYNTSQNFDELSVDELDLPSYITMREWLGAHIQLYLLFTGLIHTLQWSLDVTVDLNAMLPGNLGRQNPFWFMDVTNRNHYFFNLMNLLHTVKAFALILHWMDKPKSVYCSYTFRLMASEEKISAYAEYIKMPQVIIWIQQ
jgi:hypothetical protein